MRSDFAQYHIREFPDTTPFSWRSWMRMHEKLQTCHAPTAETSFLTLWCWYGGSAISLSRLGSYYLVIHGDKITATLLGGGGFEKSELPLFHRILRQCNLRFVPEDTARALEYGLQEDGQFGIFRLKPERDQFDYVYELDQLATLYGGRLAKKRKRAQEFSRGNRIEVVMKSLRSPGSHDAIMNVFARWESTKRHVDYAAAAKERDGVRSWPMSEPGLEEVRCVILLVNGQPAGISVIEPSWNSTWIGVLFKVDLTIPGAGEYLRQESARLLLSLEVQPRPQFLNAQQDMGVEGLRHAKLAYQPCWLERKYAVARVTGEDSQELHEGEINLC